MHRTEGEDNLANLFTDGPLGTVVEENWLNAVQEEIAKVIEEAGLTLKTAATESRDQLFEALGLSLALWPPYVSSMTGDESFTYSSGSDRKYLLNPGVANRDFDPSGTFPAGFEATIINTGNVFNVFFDSSGLNQAVTPGTKVSFVYTGTEWI